MERYAFFDFDGTLIRGDSFGLFARFAVGRAAFFKAVFISSPWIIAWKLRCISSSKAKERLFGKLFGGMPYADFKRYGEAFSKVIESRIKLDTVRRLREHVDAGDTVVIVTASMAEWIAPWAKGYGVDTLLTTAPEVSEATGRLNGRFLGANCHGAEKARRITERFGSLKDAEVWAYGDSAGDDAMLALADHPCRIE